MGDYSGFATLGDIITGGSRREAEANYPKYLAEAAGYGKALDVAAQERAKRLARDVVGEKYRAWAASQGLSPEAADLGATYATGGNMNLNTQIAGSERLQDMGFDRLIDEALQAGDQKRAQQLSAVKTDKILPTLEAGGKAVFTPVTGGVELTNLGDAAIGAENALAEQRAAAGRLSNVKANAGGFAPRAPHSGGGGSRGRSASEAKAIIGALQKQMNRPLTPDEIATIYSGGDFNFQDAPGGSLGDAAPGNALPAGVSQEHYDEVGQALKDARAAVATGRITKEEARQRLIKAGYKASAARL